MFNLGKKLKNKGILSMEHFDYFNTAKNNFVNFLTSFKDEQGFIGVKMSVPYSDSPELIINLASELYNKVDYFREAYDDDLILKNNNKVSVISYLYSENFEELENLMKPQDYTCSCCKEDLENLEE